MGALNGLPVSEALAPRRAFYELLGTASATMIGLLFAAASVAAGVFSADRQATQRMFLSASVVHFSSVLAACLTVLAPFSNWRALGVVILGLGLFGVGYSGAAWRDTVRDGLHSRIDLEDRLWYAAFPVVAYLLEVASGILVALRLDLARSALAVSIAVLLMIGIHNAWDITVWSITRRKQ